MYLSLNFNKLFIFRFNLLIWQKNCIKNYYYIATLVSLAHNFKYDDLILKFPRLLFTVRINRW